MTVPIDLPNEDEAYLRDQQNQREHELAMAQERRRAIEERRSFVATVLAGLAVVVLAIATITGLYFGTRHGHETSVRIERERNDIAKLCIQTGKIWINNNCIPTTVSEQR